MEPESSSRVHKNMRVFHVLSLMNPLRTHPSYSDLLQHYPKLTSVCLALVAPRNNNKTEVRCFETWWLCTEGIC